MEAVSREPRTTETDFLRRVVREGNVVGRDGGAIGPRCVGVTSALLWGGGFLVGFLGIKLHSLPLL